MQVKKLKAACAALVVAIACCKGSSSSTSSSGHAASSSSAGSGSSSAGTTTCTEAACQALITCCDTGSFSGVTQEQVCVDEAQDCATCAASLAAYEASGACAAPASSSSSGGTGGVGGSAGSSSGSSASSSSSSGASCGLPDGGGKAYAGTVLLSRSTTTSPTVTTTYGIVGDFVAATSAPSTACTGTKSGACCYETTASSTSVAEPAGMLTVTDGAKTLATFTSQPYEATNATVTTLSWAAGSTLGVATTGGTVDAFDLSVVAPAVLAGVAPSFAGTIVVSKSVKLAVTWTPSGEACSQVVFGLSQTGASTLAHISCVADDAAGTLTVPEALLAKLTATTGHATIERIESAGVDVANATVQLDVSDAHVTSVTFTK